MASMPNDPQAFAEQVVNLLRRIKPELHVTLTGPREIIVNGRRLDLENLFKLVKTDRQRGTEIVEQYLEHLFDDDSFAAAAMPWEMARRRIMPRIQPESIFNHLSRELVAHVPFVNDTVVVFVIDMPHMTVSVTTEQMIRWGTEPDELDEIARKNLAEYTRELDFRYLDTEDGGKALLLSEQDGYDASRLLLQDLYDRLAPELEGDFFVATPSRDMMLALTRDPEPFVEHVKSRVDHDYARLPYPITSHFFYVTRDGVAGTEAA